MLDKQSEVSVKPIQSETNVDMMIQEWLACTTRVFPSIVV